MLHSDSMHAHGALTNGMFPHIDVIHGVDSHPHLDRADLPRGYRVPLNGMYLVVFFLPCAALATFVAVITPPESLIVAGDWCLRLPGFQRHMHMYMIA